MARIELDWTGGVNQLEDPQAIKDNQVVESVNSYPTLNGTLDKREPVQAAGSVVDDGVLAIKPVTLFVPDKVLGIDFILHGCYNSVAQGEFISAIQLNATVKRLVPDGKSVFFNLANNSLAGPVKFVNYKSRVIAVVEGVEGFYQLGIKPDGTLYWTHVSFVWPATTAGVVAAQVQSTLVKPSCVAVYRGRLVFSYKNWLIFGDRDAETGWENVDSAPTWARVGDDVLSVNGRHLDLAAIQGEDIIAMKEISLSATGNPMESALLVRTNRSTVICTGAPAQTTDSEFDTAAGYIGDFQASKVNFDCGIVGKNAECSTPYGIVWAADDEVWLMNGNAPVAIGTAIRPILRNTPPNLRSYWSMAYANGFVFLAIATEASSTERDLRIQHWRLDLRKMQDAGPCWFGPQDYETLPDTAAAGDLNGTGMACSIVSKKFAGENDLVYGAVQARGITTATKPTTFIVTFNQGQGGDDTPFFQALTARVWSAADNAAGTVIPLGDLVRPSIFKANGRLYVATAVTTGIPSAAEPVWPVVNGGTVVDGGVSWTEIVNDTYFNRLPSYYGSDYNRKFLMSVRFKDLHFNQPNRDKLVRRGDLNAYSSHKSLVQLQMIMNQGAWSRYLGPSPIGGQSRANNDLGLLILDSSQLAYEYQSRALFPSVATYNENDTASVAAGGVIRGQSIQPLFTDDDGILIDSSNDYVTFCTYLSTKPETLSEAATVQLTHGRYANVDAVLTELANKMNVAMANFTQGLAFTWNANPWSYDSAFVTHYPYMTTITFAFTARRTSGGNPYMVAFVFGDTSEDMTTLLNGTVNAYPKRTKRLLSMLGYDTTNAHRNAAGLAVVFATGEGVQLASEQQSPVLASPTRVCGVQSIPYTRSPVLSIASIELDYYVKAGLPFTHNLR